MRKWIAVAAVLAGAPLCHAQSRLQVCQERVHFVGMAASMRDAGLSPQQVFARMQDLTPPDVPIAWEKMVINDMFFVPRIRAAPPEQLGAVFAQVCMHPHAGQFTPLR